MRKELKKDYKGLTKVHNLMKKDRKNVITLDAKAEDSGLLYIGENYQYIMYTLGAIVVVMAMLRLLPRQNA